MACGAGLPILALAVIGGHFIIVLGFRYIASRLPKSRWTPSLLQVSYEDGREILRDVLITCTQHHFAVSRLQVERVPTPSGAHDITHLAGAAEPVNADDLALADPTDPEKSLCRVPRIGSCRFYWKFRESDLYLVGCEISQH